MGKSTQYVIQNLNKIMKFTGFKNVYFKYDQLNFIFFFPEFYLKAYSWLWLNKNIKYTIKMILSNKKVSESKMEM